MNDKDAMEELLGEIGSYKFSNLDDVIEFELNGVIEKESNKAYTLDNMMLCVSCLDYTTLKVSDTEDSVRNFATDLCKKIERYRLPEVASLCVYPNFIPVIKKELAGTGIHSDTVAAAFPSGQSTMRVKTEECRDVVQAGADEIDVVIRVGAIVSGAYREAYEELKAIREICGGKCLKVILETGELKTSESIFRAALTAMYAGADFIKTSTGKTPVGATPEAVYIMAEAIKQYYERTGRKVGLKVSGGISKVTNAVRYLSVLKHVLGDAWATPGLFRIGSSLLLDNLIKEISALKDTDSQ